MFSAFEGPLDLAHYKEEYREGLQRIHQRKIERTGPAESLRPRRTPLRLKRFGTVCRQRTILVTQIPMPVPPTFRSDLHQFIHTWMNVNPRDDRYLGDRPFDQFVLTERASTWREITTWIGELQGRWCFRGQREASWTLATSMDRASTVAYSTPNSTGHHHLDRREEERELLQLFRQHAHRHTDPVPVSDDCGSWLAMMQHYGVPTRLLDWTASPYVGLYFALDDEPVGSYAALWALDLDWLTAAGHTLLPLLVDEPPTDDLKARINHLNRLLYDTGQAVIVSIDPPTTTDRMAAQQGLLLFKLIDQASFSQMLMSMIMHGGVPLSPVIRKLEIAKHLRVRVLERLRRKHVDSVALFPGLDGFGKSLRAGLEIKVLRAVEAALRESRALEKQYLTKRRQHRRQGRAAPQRRPQRRTV